jgi:hypothetical protein
MKPPMTFCKVTVSCDFFVCNCPLQQILVQELYERSETVSAEIPLSQTNGVTLGRDFDCRTRMEVNFNPRAQIVLALTLFLILASRTLSGPTFDLIKSMIRTAESGLGAIANSSIFRSPGGVRRSFLSALGLP